MLIDQLEPGGAQRQCCLLAGSLQRLGFVVEVLVFRDDDFFADRLREDGVMSVHLECRNRLHLSFVVWRAVRCRRPDVVMGFLSWPNLMAELAGMPRRDFAVIASERNLDLSNPGPRRWLRYFGHRFADVVVSNSYAQRERIKEIAPHLTERTKVIVNGVDMEYFRPATRLRKQSTNRITMLVLARLSPQKNVLRFIEAVYVVRSRHPEVDLEVDWYGKKPASIKPSNAPLGRSAWRQGTAYYRKVEDVLTRYGMEQFVRFHGPYRDVRKLYTKADVVCLPSVHEGCSNVIGEAMSCGVPVLASRVSDNLRLVEEGRNGLLFDPLSVDDMAMAIVRFVSRSIAERRKMGSEGRKKAETLLPRTIFVDRYVDLITRVLECRSRRA